MSKLVINKYVNISNEIQKKQLEMSKVSQMRPPSKGNENRVKVNLCVIVLETYKKVKLTSGSEVQTFLVSDESASIILSLWDGKGDQITNGDILLLESAYSNLHHKSLTLYCGAGGSIFKLGDFFFAYDDSLNMSNKSWERDENTGIWSMKN